MTTQAQLPRRVLIVSGSFGAGHDRAADHLADALAGAGWQVDRADFVSLLPAGIGRALRAAYRVQLRTAPATWRWLLSATERGSHSAAARRLCARAGLRLMRRTGPHTAAVISTYPLASQTLGLLRRTGVLTAPAVTYLTDMSVHPLWVAEGVDAHLAVHDVPAAQARGHDAAAVRVCGPLVAADMRPATSAAAKRAARARLGLPISGRLALVVTGSWGVGQGSRTARDITATGLATAVVACGHNATLRRRIARTRAGIALGWVDDMAALYRACDVVVQSGGGMSSLEALACRLPVLTYRPLPGHGEASAAALDQAGWAPWIRSREGLAAALTTATPTIEGPKWSNPDIDTIIAGLAGLPTSAPSVPAAEPVAVPA